MGDYSLLLSNNARCGGTCFGDSGGPNFIGDSNVIAGVTSFGMNSTCAGTGGVYRMDRTDDLEWLATFASGCGKIRRARLFTRGLQRRVRRDDRPAVCQRPVE